MKEICLCLNLDLGFPGPSVKVEAGFEFEDIYNVMQNVVASTKPSIVPSTQTCDVEIFDSCKTEVIEPTPIKR